MKPILFVSIIFFALISAVSAQTASNNVFKQVQENDSFKTDGMTWLGMPRAGFVTRWSAITVGDRVAICGAVTFPNLQMRGQSREVLRKSFIIYNGKRILRDLSFFSTVKREQNLRGARTNCVMTQTTAVPDAEVFLAFDDGSYKG